MQPSTTVIIQTTYEELLSIERAKGLLTAVTSERDKAKNTIIDLLAEIEANNAMLEDLLAELEANDAMLEELKSLVIFFTTENYLLIEATNHVRFRELLGIQVFEENL